MYHYIFYRSQRITLLIATRCSVYWGRVSMDWSSSVLTTSTMSMWPSRSYATSQGQIKQQRDTCTAHDKHIDKQVQVQGSTGNLPNVSFDAINLDLLTMALTSIWRTRGQRGGIHVCLTSHRRGPAEVAALGDVHHLKNNVTWVPGMRDWHKGNGAYCNTCGTRIRKTTTTWSAWRTPLCSAATSASPLSSWGTNWLLVSVLDSVQFLDSKLIGALHCALQCVQSDFPSELMNASFTARTCRPRWGTKVRVCHM